MSILALGRKQKKRGKQKEKIPNQRLEESKKKKKEKFTIKDRKKTKEIYREVFGLDNILTIQNCHKQTRKETKP